MTIGGDLIDRAEIFDEADLDAALARFDALRPQARQPHNAASRVWESFQASLAANDRTRSLAIAAEDIVSDDRRPIVGAGIQRGRDVNVADMRAFVDIGIDVMTSTVIATRGERLVLDRVRLSARDQAPEPFYTEVLRVLEIDADNRIAACIAFAPDDIDAAFEELDARYLAGEAAAHSRTWSVIAGAYTGFNRHESPSTTTDSVFIDHRPLVTMEAVDLAVPIRAVWDITPDTSIYIDEVHRLSELGAVVTQVLKGTSPAGFNAEWRTINLLTVKGDLLSRCECFDEASIDSALARLEELHPPTPRLENAASRADHRFFACSGRVTGRPSPTKSWPKTVSSTIAAAW